MDSGTLDVFHEAGNEHVLAVIDGIDLELSSLDVLIDEDGVLDALLEYDPHVFGYVRIAERYYHVLSAQDVRRSEEHGVSELVCSLESLLARKDGISLGSRDAEALEELIEPLPVLSHVDGIS